MRRAAAEGKFELAAKYRDAAANIEAVFGHRSRTFEHPRLPDRLTPPGEAAVLALAKRLGTAAPPRTIICFDISNILGTLAVASMVTFTDGRPDRQAYRRFRIRTVTQSDDFRMMREAVSRHFGRLLREHRKLPDLLMVDGGRGQLSSALDALADVDAPPLPVISLAKRDEEIFLPGRPEPMRLDRHDPALRLLQAARDESHRFAITYHRELREKRIRASLLDDIPGIGEVRKKELLNTFGSLARLARADAEEIARRIPGIGPRIAEKIRASLDRRLRRRPRHPEAPPEA